jgi:hypothetical protein
MANGDTSAISNQLLYPLDDPTTAFRNALSGTGINPYRSNPFVTQLMKAAQGSRIAYLANAAGQGASPDATDPSGGFGNYLKQALSSGTLMSNLNSTAQNYGNVINGVSQYEQNLNQGSGAGAAAANPFYAALRDIFGANDGQGALSAYATLRTPSLGALGSSWASGVQQAGQSAMANFARNGGPTDNVWDWLFGTRGQGSHSGAFGGF